MFGWSMEEEAKLEFTIKVNWRQKDGSIPTTQFGMAIRHKKYLAPHRA